MSQLSKVLSILVVNIIFFSTIGNSSIVYADSTAISKNTKESVAISKEKYDDTSIYNVRIASGEQLIKIKDGQNIYNADICSNKNEITFQAELKEGVKPSDFIVTGEENSIIGFISDERPYLIKVNLKPSSNVIVIKNKRDNSELYKFYINYKNVQIDGLSSSVSVGDTLSLKVKSDDKVYDNVKWTSSGIKSVIINENGRLTAHNAGIANVKGTIYDTGNNIIGSVDVDFNVCGEQQSGWVNNDNKWYFIDKDTQTIKTGWIFSNGEWYCSDSSGIMQTGWICQNGTWYYLKENGTMATSWIKDNGKWYLMDAGGAMQKGWAKDHGNWYYLSDEDGCMQTGIKEIDGAKYTFNAHGELQGNDLKK